MTQVIKFPKTPRRAAMARLASHYPSTIARTISKSMISDSTIGDNGEPLVRKMTRTEERHAGVSLACEFLWFLMRFRAAVETPGTSTDEKCLHTFAYHAHHRVIEYRRDQFGRRGEIFVPPEEKRFLETVEKNIAKAVFTGLKIEMHSSAPPDEIEFWTNVFRGFADADPSGVILRAAGLVLLDHLDAFREALAFHGASWPAKKIQG